MSGIPASILNSCTLSSYNLLASSDSTACGPRTHNEYSSRAVCSARVPNAQEESQEHPSSATGTPRRMPVFGNTPTTGDSTPVKDAFEKTHMAEGEARTVGLEFYLDKIDQESHRSVKGLETTLQDVERAIYALSPHGLSPIECATGRHNAACQCQNTARSFFYNKDFNRGSNRCSSRPLPELFDTHASDHRYIQSDDSSVSSTSVSIASLPLTHSRHEESLTSEKSTLLTAFQPTHSGRLSQTSASVPRNLEDVFDGLSTIQHNTRKLCARLRHAKTLVARASLEVHASSAWSDRLAQSTLAGGVPMRKALGFELLDDIEYSVKIVERLRVQVDHLERKSRKRLNELYKEMQLRHKFKLSPWQSKVKKLSPVVLRALSGLKNVTYAQRRCLASVKKNPNPGSHLSPPHGFALGLSIASTTSSASATGPANWSYGMPAVIGGKRVTNKQKGTSISTSPITSGKDSIHYSPPGISTLKSFLKTPYRKEVRGTTGSDTEILLQRNIDRLRRQAGYGEGNGSQSPYCASTPKRSHTATKTLSAASLSFAPAWCKTEGTVCALPQPKPRDLSSYLTACHTSQKGEGPCSSLPRRSAVRDTIASCFGNSACFSRFQFRHSHAPLLHAGYKANESPRNPHACNGRDNGLSLSTPPQSALCLSCERRSRFLLRTRLDGSCTRSSCEPCVVLHDAVRQRFLQKPHEGDGATSTASHSHNCSPGPGAGLFENVPRLRQSPKEHLRGDLIVRRGGGMKTRAAASLGMGPETISPLHAPCDIGRRTAQQSDTLSHGVLTCVSCRLLPSPSPSIKHPFAGNTSPTEKLFGLHFSELGVF